jgi:hypothetical protein
MDLKQNQVSNNNSNGNGPKNQELIKNEITLMMNYATRNGLTLPTTLNIDKEDSTKLIEDYNTLNSIIKPATTRSINYIEHNILANNSSKHWYQFELVTKCLLITGISLLILIAVSLLPIVNEENQSKSILINSGWPLLFNLVFICSASLLGVMFYLLKTLMEKIKNYTLVPADALEINATIIIGIISGFIISELFTFSFGNLGEYVEVQKMSLALLGGFASNVIFSILNGFVNRLKAITNAEPHQ